MTNDNKRDPLAELGRAVLTILLDPVSWQPGPTQAIVAITAAAQRLRGARD